MAKTANWDSYLCLSLCFIAIELSGVHTEQSCYGSVSSTKLTCTGCPLDLPGPPPVPPTIGGSGGCNALCIALICAALILAAVGITCAIVLYGKKKRKWCWKEKSSKGGRTFYPKRGDVGAASSVEMGAANPALTNGESPTHKASPGHSDPGSPTRKRHHKKKHTRSHSPSPAHSGKVGPATETDGVSKSTDPLFDPDAKYVYPGTPPRDLPPVNTEENDESPRRKKKKKRKHKKKAEIAGDEEETGQPTLVSVNPKHMKSTAQSSVEPLPPVNVTAPPSALSPLKNPRPLPLPPLGTSDGHA